MDVERSSRVGVTSSRPPALPFPLTVPRITCKVHDSRYSSAGLEYYKLLLLLPELTIDQMKLFVPCYYFFRKVTRSIYDATYRRCLLL